MPDEQRLKLEQNEEAQQIKEVIDRLDVAVHLMNSLRQVRDGVDGRGISIAITHVETAALWFRDAVKTEDF